MSILQEKFNCHKKKKNSNGVKIRKIWKINPKTRVKNSKKEYLREKEKEKEKKEKEDEQVEIGVTKGESTGSDS